MLVTLRVIGTVLGLVTTGALFTPSNNASPATLHVPLVAPRAGTCVPADQCCKICSKGKACGNTCISASYTCHKGRGCACNASEVCE